MAKTSGPKGLEKPKDLEKNLLAWPGAATHQIAVAAKRRPTPNQDVVLADNPNALKSDEGVIELHARAILGQCIESTKQQRGRDREVRPSGDQT